MALSQNGKTQFAVLLLFAMAVMLTITGGAAAQEAIDLRPLWQDGQTSRYRSTTTQQSVTTVSAMGDERTVETQMDFNVELTWRVIDADEEGGGECEMTVDAISVTLTGPEGQQMQADSHSSDEGLEPLEKLFKAISNAPIQVKVGPSGEIESIDGWQKIRSQGGPAAEPLEEVDFIETVTDVAAISGAGQDLEPGDDWQQEFDWPHEAGMVQLESTYELLGVEQIEGIPVAAVAVESDVDFTFDEEMMPVDGPPVDAKLIGGEDSAHFLFDLSRHEIVGGVATRQLEFRVEVPMGNQKFSTHVLEHTTGRIIRISEQW